MSIKSRPVLFLIWGLAALIALLALENFYSRHKAAQALPLTRLYLAGTRTPAQAIPADGSGIVIWQGVKPQNFGSRDIHLLYRLASLPRTYSVLLAGFRKDIETWKKSGSSVKGVFIDYASDKPDWAALARLVSLLKTTSSDYDIFLVAKPVWFAGNGKENPYIADIQKNIRFLTFDLDAAVISGQSPADFVAGLEKIRFPFYLIVDKSVDTAAFHKQHTASAKFFAGFIIALENKS